jgi:hypothetical protein
MALLALLARRNALWLAAIELGLPDVWTCELVPVTVAGLAGLWCLSAQAVRDGIAAARVARDRSGPDRAGELPVHGEPVASPAHHPLACARGTPAQPPPSA